jgi:hypothetical protein
MCFNSDVNLGYTSFADMKTTSEDNSGLVLRKAFWQGMLEQDKKLATFRGNHVNASAFVGSEKDVVPIILAPADAVKVKQVSTNCAICGKHLGTDREKQLDHDHLTGRFRGVICRGCNIDLGRLEKFISNPCLFFKLLSWVRG